MISWQDHCKESHQELLCFVQWHNGMHFGLSKSDCKCCGIKKKEWEPPSETRLLGHASAMRNLLTPPTQSAAKAAARRADPSLLHNALMNSTNTPKRQKNATRTSPARVNNQRRPVKWNLPPRRRRNPANAPQPTKRTSRRRIPLRKDSGSSIEEEAAAKGRGNGVL